MEEVAVALQALRAKQDEVKKLRLALSAGHRIGRLNFSRKI
jgi:hypothetical protein